MFFPTTMVCHGLIDITCLVDHHNQSVAHGRAGEMCIIRFGHTHDLSRMEHERTSVCPTRARLNPNYPLHIRICFPCYGSNTSLPSLARRHTLATSTTLFWSHNASSPAAPVGIKEAPTSDIIDTKEESNPSAADRLFPHIYGPINPEAVTDELVVNRTEEGSFSSIEGL